MATNRGQFNKMNARIKDGLIQINISDLFESMSEESKLTFLESLSCDSFVIKCVTDQILEGCTENGSFGFTGAAESDPKYGLDYARRRVALEVGGVAKKEIERLQESLKRKELEVDALYTKLSNRGSFFQ